MPVSDIHLAQQKFRDRAGELRWIVALLSDIGMQIGEVTGLLKTDINPGADISHITLEPHFWR